MTYPDQWWWQVVMRALVISKETLLGNITFRHDDKLTYRVRVMLIGQIESETARFLLRDASIQRRLVSDVFGYVIGEKLDRSPFLHHFHTKTTHFGFRPCCIVRLFSICCNVQKQIFFFVFIFWRHYVIYVKHNSFCRLDDREVKFVQQTTCNYAWYVRKGDPRSSFRERERSKGFTNLYTHQNDQDHTQYERRWHNHVYRSLRTSPLK